MSDIFIYVYLAGFVGIIALCAYFAMRQRRRDGIPRGVYGWLIIPGFTVALMPLYILSNIAQMDTALGTVPVDHPIHTLLWVIIIAYAVLIVLAVRLAINFFKQRRSTPGQFVLVNFVYVAI